MEKFNQLLARKWLFFKSVWMLVVAMSCAKEEEEVHTSSSSVGIANELLEGLICRQL